MTTQAEIDFIPPLIAMVKDGDLRWGEAVAMFREEFRCSLTYVVSIGLADALKRSAGQVAGDYSGIVASDQTTGASDG